MKTSEFSSNFVEKSSTSPSATEFPPGAKKKKEKNNKTPLLIGLSLIENDGGFENREMLPPI